MPAPRRGESLPDVIDDVAVGIDHADLRHVAPGELLLAARLAQHVLDAEHRRGAVIGAGEERRAPLGPERVTGAEIVHELSRMASAGAVRCWVETRMKVATMRTAALMLPREIARDLGGAAAAAAIGHRNFEDAQAGAGGAHLHLDVPAIGHLAHAEREQRVAADRAERAHVGVAHAVEQPHAEPGEKARRELVPRHAAGLARAAQPRADDEVASAGADRRDERGDARGIVGAVAVHEDENVGVVRRHRGGEAGAAIAAADVEHLGAGVPRPRARSHRCCRCRRR